MVFIVVKVRSYTACISWTSIRAQAVAATPRSSGKQFTLNSQIILARKHFNTTVAYPTSLSERTPLLAPTGFKTDVMKHWRKTLTKMMSFREFRMRPLLLCFMCHRCQYGGWLVTAICCPSPLPLPR